MALLIPSTAFPLRRFPHEICDVIIDQFKPKETVSPYGTVQWVINSRALKSCALVSREWRPRAQLWLVHYIWLASLECLRKLESFLDLKTQYIPEIRAIQIRYGNYTRYPVRNLATAAVSLVRRCPNLSALCIDIERGIRDDEGAESNSPYFPFHARFHTAVYRQSFIAVTVLLLDGVYFHNDTDFSNFLFSFASLEDITLNSVTCDVVQRINEADYILQLKNRRHPFEMLRSLRMVCELNYEY